MVLKEWIIVTVVTSAHSLLLSTSSAPGIISPTAHAALQRELNDASAGLGGAELAYLELLQQNVRVTADGGADTERFFGASELQPQTAPIADLAAPGPPAGFWADTSSFEKEIEAASPVDSAALVGQALGQAQTEAAAQAVGDPLSAGNAVLAEAQEAAERQVTEAGQALAQAQAEAAVQVRRFHEAAQHVQEAWAHVQAANEWAAKAAAAKAQVAGQLSAALGDQSQEHAAGSAAAIARLPDATLFTQGSFMLRQEPNGTAAPAPPPAEPAPAPAGAAPVPAPAQPQASGNATLDAAVDEHKRCGHAGQVPCTTFLRYFTFFYTTAVWRSLVDWLGISLLMLGMLYNCFQRRFCGCGLFSLGLGLIVFGVLRPQHG